MLNHFATIKLEIFQLTNYSNEMISYRALSYLAVVFFATTNFSFGIIDFEKQVWPIFVKRCIECHKSPHEQAGRLKKPKAGLRLDGAAHILIGSDSGSVVVVDHPSQSSLYQRVVLPIEDSEHMPPKGDPLTMEQKEILRKWIAQGVDFGAWEGATDGLEDLQIKKAEEFIPEHLQFFKSLSIGLKELPRKLLLELTEETGLLIRPIGVGSPLIEARMVSSSVNITDQELSLLKPLRQHLVKLDLTGADLSDQACRRIKQFKQLTHLNLRGTKVGDEGMKHLIELQNLQNLNLCETMVSDFGTNPILGMVNLKSLHLWKSEVTKEKRGFLRQRLSGVEITP